MADINTASLPLNIRAQLAELELELSNHEITQKGYHKKRAKLLEPFANQQRREAENPQRQPAGSPGRQRHAPRRDDVGYSAGVRVDAVQVALGRFQAEDPTPAVRRQALAAAGSGSADRGSDGEFDSDGGWTANGSQSADNSLRSGTASQRPPIGQQKQQQQAIAATMAEAAAAISAASGDRQQQQQQQQQQDSYVIQGNAYQGMPTNQSRTQPTGGGGGGGGTHAGVSSTLRRVDRLGKRQQEQQQQQQQQKQQQPRQAQQQPPAESRTSQKIQQLVATLARPKRRTLPDMYADDDDELVYPAEANAPQPQGDESAPVVGECPASSQGLPATLEEALLRYSSGPSGKSIAISSVESGGKLGAGVTYAKLYSRARKLAYGLLNRLGHKGDASLKPGDRVGLVFPNSDAACCSIAFLACQLAGLTAVPVEAPPANAASTGFLLSSLEVRVLVTSEAFMRAMPKAPGTHEPAANPGWPSGLMWTLVDAGLSSPPKDWQPPALHGAGVDSAQLSYAEYAYARDGSVRGVCVTRGSVLAHTRALCSACSYASGEIVVCLLDNKREIGLWHAVLAATFVGLQVIFVPYSVMKLDPVCWLRLVTKQKASVALVKSRDLYWSLLAYKEGKEVNLASLRCLVVADGANPWSLTSCDSFVNVFRACGLRPEVVCPCAFSSESLTVSIRRPGVGSDSATGRGVLSMLGLSHGVVRVDSENSYTSLTLQDCGVVMPNAAVAVVKLGQQQRPQLCRQDEVGEICVCAQYAGHKYWGLQGPSSHAFRCQPVTESGDLVSDRDPFVRTGLLGFLGPPASGGLVFVCGSTDGLMTVSGRRHNADDLIATVLAVEPLKFVFRGRVAVFSQEVLRDERVIVVAEQRPDATEEHCFQWMSHVLQAVESIHQVGVYCIALVAANSLPRSPLGGINVHETRKRYIGGQLHPCNVLMCPHSTVTNLPKQRQPPASSDAPRVGPMSMVVGSLVQGGRLAWAEGRQPTDESLSSLADSLRQKSREADYKFFTCVNAKGQETQALTVHGLHKRAERIGALLRSRAHSEAAVALILPPGTDLICAVFGCLYAGCVPLPARPPQAHSLQSTLNTCKLIVEAGQAVLVLTTQQIAKQLKCKEAQALGCTWPPILDIEDARRRHSSNANALDSAGQTDPKSAAYLDFSVSTTGLLTGVRVSQMAAASFCRSLKLQCELYPTRELALCLDPYSGLGFVLWCLSGVADGHRTLLLPPNELEANPAAFLQLISQRSVRDVFCSYPVMELCTKELGPQVDALKQQKNPVNLSSLRSLVVVSEERPRLSLLNGFGKLFAPLGLKPAAVSASFGCRVNPCLCLQGASSPEASTLFVDSRALRHDRVSLVERGSPRSLALMESGQLLSGVTVVIANPETRTQCADSHLGEIWVSSKHNADCYCAVVGGEAGDHFGAVLATGEPAASEVAYARTGCLGFLRRTDRTGNDGARHDAVFVVGALEEALLLRGMRYHPCDIEATAIRCHPAIADAAVFTWQSLLVVVAELNGKEKEALDLIPPITSSILEEQHLIPGVVVICDPGAIPLNSRGEKQRRHLRDGFLDDKLDPIYVAYNL